MSFSKCYSVSTSADSAVTAQESTEIFEEETPNKVKKVELEIQSDKEDSSTSTNSDVGKILCTISSNILSNPHVYFFSFFFKKEVIILIRNNYLLCNFHVYFLCEERRKSIIIFCKLFSHKSLSYCPLL